MRKLEHIKVSDQNGVSLLYIMLEIHHFGREPLRLCCQSVVKWHEVARILAFVNYIRETTVNRSCKYGKYVFLSTCSSLFIYL